jgi:cell wall-associated NlpC family hydrolase
MVMMLFLSVGDTKMYRTSLLTAAEKRILLENALAQIGKPYELGANGPQAYDCSSLMIDVFKEIGIDLPRRSVDQAEIGKEISF